MVFPRQFWILFVGSFIQAFGWGLVFPFITLYARDRLGVSLVQVGFVLFSLSAGALIGMVVGGHITDRIGRRPVLVITSLLQAVGILSFVYAQTISSFMILGFLLGIVDASFFPAENAMVADIVSPDLRTRAYGILRIVKNLAIVAAPALGGLMAEYSYRILWTSAAGFLALFVVIAVVWLKETMSRAEDHAVEEGSYRLVLEDRLYLRFLFAVTISFVAVAQLASTLPVFIKEQLGYGESLFGLLFSVNAALVVILQYPTLRRVERLDPARTVAFGTFLYGVGFLGFGYSTSYAALVVSMVVLTFGEIITVPVQTAITAGLSPINARGRYMSGLGISFYGVGLGIGPVLGGYVLEYWPGALLWQLSFAVSVVASALLLGLRRHPEYRRVKEAPDMLGVR